MIDRIVTKLFGTKHERDTKKMMPVVEEINRHFEACRQLTDEALRSKTDEFRGRIEEEVGRSELR